ncbi:hypothetical protein KZ843_09610 [Pseudomonas aeruginosa]|nr:hypothetical protein [Pseudomonas aeruginosa]MBW6123141.1 hypothetical protein [Pseudomonas aeruginosa]
MTDGLKGLGGKKPFNARLPNTLRSTLESSAKLANRSLNAHIGFLLEGSVADFPVLENAPSITEPLNKEPVGIRLQDLLKAKIADGARKCGRSINSEIVIRLLLATESARPVVDSMALTGMGGIESEMSIAWDRLNRAIETMLGASVFDVSNTANELREAKSEYQRLIHLRNLALGAITSSSAS